MVMLEVKCGVRKGGTLTNINWGKGRYDVGLRLKAVLVKRDLMIHLKKTYSHSVVVSLINHFQPFLGKFNDSVSVCYFSDWLKPPTRSICRRD